MEKRLLGGVEITEEEFIILCSKPEGARLFPNPIDSLDAKISFSHLKNQNNFLEFCVFNVFCMHHPISINEMFMFIWTGLYGGYQLKKIGIDIINFLVEKLFIEYKTIPDMFKTDIFYRIQWIIFANFYDDLVFQFFLDQDCEYCILNHSNVNSQKDFYCFLQNMTYLIGNKRNEYRYINQKMLEDGIIKLIIDKSVQDYQLSPENTRKTLESLFKCFSIKDFEDLSFLDHFNTTDYFQALYFLFEPFDNGVSGSEQYDELCFTEVSIKIKKMEDSRLFSVLTKYIENHTFELELPEDELLSQALCQIFKALLPGRVLLSKNVSEQIREIATPVIQQYVPIFIGVFRFLDRVSGDFQRFLIGISIVLRSNLENSEFFNCISQMTIEKINTILDSQKVDKICIVGTFIRFYLRFLSDNISIEEQIISFLNDFLPNIVSLNGEFTYQSFRMNSFFKAIYFLFENGVCKSNQHNSEQKKREIRIRIIFLRIFSEYFSFILSDGFISTINDEKRYRRLIKHYSTAAVFSFNDKEGDFPNGSGIINRLLVITSQNLEYYKKIIGLFCQTHFEIVRSFFNPIHQLMIVLLSSFDISLVKFGLSKIKEVQMSEIKKEIIDHSTNIIIDKSSNNIDLAFNNFEAVSLVFNEIQNHENDGNLLDFMIAMKDKIFELQEKCINKPFFTEKHKFNQWMRSYLNIFGFSKFEKIHESISNIYQNIKENFELSSILLMKLLEISTSQQQLEQISSFVESIFPYLIKDAKVLAQQVKEIYKEQQTRNEGHNEYLDNCESFSSNFVLFFSDFLEKRNDVPELFNQFIKIMEFFFTFPILNDHVFDRFFSLITQKANAEVNWHFFILTLKNMNFFLKEKKRYGSIFKFHSFLFNKDEETFLKNLPPQLTQMQYYNEYREEIAAFNNYQNTKFNSI